MTEKFITLLPKQYRQKFINEEKLWLDHKPKSCLWCHLRQQNMGYPINSHCVSQSWQRKLSPDGKITECWLDTLLDSKYTPVTVDEHCTAVRQHLSKAILDTKRSIKETSTFCLLCQSCDNAFTSLDNFETLDLSQRTIRLLNTRALLHHIGKCLIQGRGSITPHIESLFSTLGNCLYCIDQNKGEFRYKAFQTPTSLPVYTSDLMTLCFDLNNKSCRTPYRSPYPSFLHIIPFGNENMIILSWRDGEQSGKFIKSLSLLKTNDLAFFRLVQRSRYPVFSSSFLSSMEELKAKQLLAAIIDGRENFRFSHPYNVDITFPIQISSEFNG